MSLTSKLQFSLFTEIWLARKLVYYALQEAAGATLSQRLWFSTRSYSAPPLVPDYGTLAGILQARKSDGSAADIHMPRCGEATCGRQLKNALWNARYFFQSGWPAAVVRRAPLRVVAKFIRRRSSRAVNQASANSTNLGWVKLDRKPLA